MKKAGFWRILLRNYLRSCGLALKGRLTTLIDVLTAFVPSFYPNMTRFNCERSLLFKNVLKPIRSARRVSTKYLLKHMSYSLLFRTDFSMFLSR